MSDVPPQAPASISPAQAPSSEIAIFIRDLNLATPRVWVTYAIIAANVVVFALMVAKGVSFFNPSAASVLPWGADYGPKTLNGQQWRLFTSMFVHFGIIHIAMNMFVLYQFGPLVERLLGNIAFLVAYVLSGLFGSLLSVSIHPNITSAGASGAIFGVIGALFGFLLMQRGVVPKPLLMSLSKTGAIFVVYNVFYGTMQKSIDMSAHMGGLIGGFVLGVALSRRLVPGAGIIRAAMVAIAGLALTHVLVHKIQAPADADAILAFAQKTESDAIDKYNQAVKDWKSDKIDDKQVIDLLQNQIIPPYSQAIDQLKLLKASDDVNWDAVQRSIAYRTKRLEGWKARIVAIKSENSADVDHANALSDEADTLAQQINGTN